MIMGNSEDFQRQFTCLMKNLLHSAVTETTKLFESTVHEMRTELMQRKQNDRNKDNVTICPDQGGCMRSCKDIGIQCVGKWSAFSFLLWYGFPNHSLLGLS